MSPLTLQLSDSAMRPTVPSTLDIFASPDICSCPSRKKRSLKCSEGGFSEFAYKFPKLCDSTLKSTCPLLSISTPCASGSSRHCPPTKVLPFLFLGSEEDAQSEDILQTCRVKYILNASQTAVDSPYCKSGYYLKIPIQDNSSQNIVAWFQTAFDFIDKVKESDDHVLIHCVGGVSRSATIAIAYVMRHLSLSLDNAYRYVKEKRPTISPNLNFMGQLLQYEQQLLKETNLINTPFSELNLDGLRSPTQILRKNFVLHEEIDTYHAHNTSGFPSPRSEDLVPSRALDLLPDVTGSTNIRDNRTLGYNAGIPQATCNYTTRLEVFPSPGSDDVPSPTGSELSNSSEFYDSSGSTSAPPVTNNKPLTLNLGMLKNDFHKKCPSRDFTLELGPKKKR